MILCRYHSLDAIYSYSFIHESPTKLSNIVSSNRTLFSVLSAAHIPLTCCAVPVRPLSRGLQSRRRLLYWRQRIHGKQWGLSHGRLSTWSLLATEYCRFFFLFRSETNRLTEDRRTRRLYVNLQTGDSVQGDSKHIGVKCHKEFVNWVVLSLNCNLNKQ